MTKLSIGLIAAAVALSLSACDRSADRAARNDKPPRTAQGPDMPPPPTYRDPSIPPNPPENKPTDTSTPPEEPKRDSGTPPAESK